MVTMLVDGSPHTHELFSNLCQECPDVQLFMSTQTVEEGLSLLATHRPQLVFLGNNMTDGNAEELIRRTSVPFEKVLLFEQNTFSGLPYRSEILAYMLAPFEKEAFQAVVKKAIRKFRRTSQLAQTVDDLSLRLEKLEAAHLPTLFSISNTEGILFRKINDIIYLKAQKNYTEFVMANTDSPLIASTNLGAFENMFAMYPHIKKIHRSHMVNLKHVNAYLRKGGGYLIMRKGMKLKVSKHYKQDMLDTLKQL